MTFIDSITKKNPLFWTVDKTEINRVTNTFKNNLPQEKNLPQGRIIDIGCFNGNTTFEISKMYPKYDLLGIDILNEHIKQAEQRRKAMIKDLENNNQINSKQKEFFLERLEDLEFEVANGFELPYAEKFSMMFYMNNIIFILEGRKPKEFENMMKNIHFHLEYGGYVIFSANEEYFILQKLKNEYKLTSKNIVSEIRIQVFKEIFEELNKVSKP